MENVQKTYSAFHAQKKSVHTYPTEWVIRTFLGKYPDLDLDKSKYRDANLLDLGFGDCRNMPLLHNCKFKIHGVEISDAIIDLGKDKLAELGIDAVLKRGSNTGIPFENGFFDYILACHSCYYMDEGAFFDNNLAEMARVLKRGGTLIASLPAPDNFILKDCKKLDNGHVIITNDIYGLRNGYVFKTFDSKEDVINTFSPFFRNISVCHCADNFWGVQINFFIVACERK